MATSEKTKLQITMSKELAEDGKLILNELGTTPANFVNMAYKRLVAERKIPFNIGLTDEENAKLTILMASKKQKPTVLDTPAKVQKWSEQE